MGQRCSGARQCVLLPLLANTSLAYHAPAHPAVDAALVTREELRQEGGRHRYRYQPPATPQEFWNMDMTP